jgi:hypothetical protein
MVKQVIVAHQRLFVEEYLTDSSEIEAIIHQMIHGKLHHKSINYINTDGSLSLSGGGDQSDRLLHEAKPNRPLTGSSGRWKRSLPEISWF